MGNSKSTGKGVRSTEEDSTRLCEKNFCDFLEATRKCEQLQTRVAETLLNLADDLDTLEEDFQKAEIGMAAVGAVVTAAGLGLSFVTFGTSALVLTIVGAGLAVAATAGSISAQVARKILKSDKMKEANRAVQFYSKAVLEYAQLLQIFCDNLSTEDERRRLHTVLTDSSVSSESVTFNRVSNQRDLCEACRTGHRIVNTSLRVKEALKIEGKERNTSGKPAGQLTKLSLDLLPKASSLAEKSFKTVIPLTKAIKIGGHVVTGVGLILDIGTIIYYSLEIHKKQPSEVAQFLRTLANAFK